MIAHLGARVFVAIRIHQRHNDEAQIAQQLDVPRISLRQLVNAIETRADRNPLARMCARLYEYDIAVLIARQHHGTLGAAVLVLLGVLGRLHAHHGRQLHIVGVHPIDFHGAYLALLVRDAQRVKLDEIRISMHNILQILIDLAVLQIGVQHIRTWYDHTAGRLQRHRDGGNLGRSSPF